MKVSEDVFGYSEAIKSCLRMNPKWIMLSEARSKGGKISAAELEHRCAWHDDTPHR